MTHRDLAVLDALNIASTRFRRSGHGFEATAAQIAEVLNTDPRCQGDWPFTLSPQMVGSTLGQLAGTREASAYFRTHPLVTRIDTRRYRLTQEGVRVLGL